MATALTRKSRKIVKKMNTLDLNLKIHELRKSVREDASLLEVAERELTRRKNSELLPKETEEFNNGD